MNLDSEEFVKYLVDHNIYEHLQRAYSHLAINQPKNTVEELKNYFEKLDLQTQMPNSVSPEMAKRIILLGMPGVGKTTQCKLLQEKYGVCHISVNKLIQNELKRLKKSHDAKLTDPEILQLVINKISSNECRQKGYVLDGFPESEIQARALKATLVGNMIPTDVIEMVGSEENSFERLEITKEKLTEKIKLFNIHFAGVKKTFLDVISVINARDANIQTVFERINEAINNPHRVLYGAEVLPRGPSVLPTREQKIDFAMAHTFNTKPIIEEI